MVLKGAFDDLVKKIRSKKLMDVSMRETMCKWLEYNEIQ